MYQLALAASRDPEAMKETEARLEHLGDATKTGSSRLKSAEELSNMRTVHLERVSPETVNAEFLLIFSSGSKVDEVKFVTGSEKWKGADKALSTTAFHLPFPDDGPAKLLRRGILICSAISGCTFVLYLPDFVRSVN